MRTENQARRTTRAFTLLEIIAVMVIIALIGAGFSWIAALYRA